LAAVATGPSLVCCSLESQARSTFERACWNTPQRQWIERNYQLKVAKIFLHVFVLIPGFWSRQFDRRTTQYF
jgi:hypothetical protein